MNKNRKLKNYFIYPEFQWKLIALFMAISLVAPLLLLGFQLSLFRQQLENEYVKNLPEAHPYLVFQSLFQEQSLAVFTIAILVSFVLCFVFGILISHHVAGPLIKLKNHFEKVAQDEKNDSAINFRENDFFKEVATAYNLKFQNKK